MRTMGGEFLRLEKSGGEADSDPIVLPESLAIRDNRDLVNLQVLLCWEADRQTVVGKAFLF